MKAATLDPSSRAHFDESSRLLEDPNGCTVDAALWACGVYVGSTRPSAVVPVATKGPKGPVGGTHPAHGVAAAVRGPLGLPRLPLRPLPPIPNNQSK